MLSHVTEEGEWWLSERETDWEIKGERDVIFGYILSFWQKLNKRMIVATFELVKRCFLFTIVIQGCTLGLSHSLRMFLAITHPHGIRGFKIAFLSEVWKLGVAFLHCW